MATSREDFIASDEIEESEPSVSHDLNCPLCLKVFRSPRRLPCLHTFCQDCLQSHISKLASVQGTVKQFCCPICRNVACSGEFSTDKLMHVFPLNILMLSVLIKSTSKVKADLVCNVCQTEGVVSPAEDICTICEEALCGQCSKVHRSSRLLTSHTILKIEDLPSRHETVLQNNVTFHCAEHASFPVEYYCKSHETQLCARCFIASHKRCSDVIELNNETPNLLDGLNQMREEMKKIESQLHRFINNNVSNLSKIESEINNLTIEIRTLKKTINDALDDLEKRVKEEGNTILDEERNRIEQLNHDCQSHITAIRNSNVTVELASIYATQNQLFLLQKKITNQLSMAKRYIDDKYTNNNILTLQLEVNPQLKESTKIPRCEIGTLWMKKNDEIPIITDGFKPLNKCVAKRVNVRYIKGLTNNIPWYTKVTFSAKNQLLLVDFDNKMFYFLDPLYNIVCSHTLPDKPFDICIVSEDGENVVVVTLPSRKLVQLFSLNNKSITYVKQIQTRHTCCSIATYKHEELVISGYCDNSKYYWSIITLDGEEKSYHEFDGKGPSQTYVALNAYKTRLYISVHNDNCLHCFGLDGMKQFTFTHHDLVGPEGVSVDRDDNVYVVGSTSRNIFKLSPVGFLIKIVVSGIEKNPMGICFDQNGDQFVLSHVRDTRLSFYRLVDKDE